MTPYPKIPENLGWAVFEAETSVDNADGRRTYQLQKNDEMGLFESDTDAQKAMLASPYKDQVMAFLQENSPAEYEDILQWAN